MKSFRLLFLMACLTPLAGCTVYDWAYAAFSQNYNGGGPNSADQRYHFDRELEKWKEHQKQTANEAAVVPEAFSR
jgi:hypothetical protein